MEGMDYVYVLRSKKDGDLYIGSTTDLRGRIAQHNNQKVFSTKHRIPFELVYCEAYKDICDARERESKLKLRGNTRYHLMQRISKSLH